MSILQEVLTNHIPPLWSEAVYSNQRYVLIEIHAGEQEYQDLVCHFQGLEVSQIQRIQNPYAWGRYVLRKEQLSLRNGNSPAEVNKYHPLRAEEIAIACEYNCDCRRYQEPYIGYGERTPRFYTRPQMAIEALSMVSGEKAILVATLLGNDGFGLSSYTTRENDTEFYPKYIVRIN